MALLVIKRKCFTFNKYQFSVPKQCFSVFGVFLDHVKNRPLLRYLPQKRTFMSFIRRPTKQQITKKDEIPDGYELIYRNTSERTILCAHVFTSFSAVAVALIAIMKIDLKDVNNSRLPFTDDNIFKNKPRETENEILIYATFFIVTLIVLQHIMHQMPQRIYYNVQKQKYWLVFNSNIPFLTKKVPLKVGEIRHSPGGITPWKEHRFELKDGQKLLLVDSYFRRPADLYIMAGVQKDPELEKEIKSDR